MAKQQIDILQALGITQWQLRTPRAASGDGQADSKAVREGTLEGTLEGVGTREITADAVATAAPEPATRRVTDVFMPTHESHLATPTAELTGTTQDASKAIPTSDTTHPLHSAPKVGAKDWATLELEFAQRSHCGERPKLDYLPPAEQRSAEYAVVLPAPSTHDIAQQQLLSEPAHHLLNEILRAVALGDSRIYQTSVLKCASTDMSEEPCSIWVQSELELLAPKFCLIFGELAARTVLKTNRPLSELRQASQVHPFLPIRCFVTHALEDLLAKPELKRECWHDLKPVVQFLADRPPAQTRELG